MESKYHAGELQLQEKFDETKMANRVGRIINDKVIAGAIPFVENQPFVIVSSTDQAANIWTSILMGEPGWINAKEEGKIRFALSKNLSTDTDILLTNLKENNQVGMIFIELATRRRYRVNGRMRIDGSNLELAIQEAYANCPKYIQRRIPTFGDQENISPIVTNGSTLGEAEKNWISQADTFFVGSQSSTGYLDASHRGGNPGFIEVLDNGDLKIPDYVGNSMYNTLGNLVQVPKAGLLFMDFGTGNILQLTGTTSFLFNQVSDSDQLKTTETGRYWLFKTERWLKTAQVHRTDWEFIDNSPFNPHVNA